MERTQPPSPSAPESVLPPLGDLALQHDIDPQWTVLIWEPQPTRLQLITRIVSDCGAQPHWVEGGEPGNIDRRSTSDRHLLIVDRDRRRLYELFNVFHNPAKANVVRDMIAKLDAKLAEIGDIPEHDTAAVLADLA